jgi:hypothetical protein
MYFPFGVLVLGLRWERDEIMQTMVLVLVNQHRYYYSK